MTRSRPSSPSSPRSSAAPSSTPTPPVPTPPTAPPLTALTAAEKRQLAARVRAVVGVDAGKFTHTLVVRPTIGPTAGADSRPIACPVTRDGFAGALAAILRAVPGAAPSEILVGIEFAGSYGFTFAHALHAAGFPV